jgi:ArsR family transcriptional regulator, arsenate/arsenite/antimonite-responsive transcriptional repressor
MSLNLAFKALNDQTRRDILELLRKKDMSAGEIAEKFNITAPSISHHLELLKRAGLIESEKKGQFIIYSLNTTVLDDIMKWVIQFNKKGK